MDAVEYLKEKRRMTQNCNISCSDCLLGAHHNGAGKHCGTFTCSHPEDAVRIVEKWSAEHPIKTRQSEFLKMFPNAELMNDGIIYMCPKFIDKTYKDDKDCSAIKCDECKKEYWLAEVE